MKILDSFLELFVIIISLPLAFALLVIRVAWGVADDRYKQLVKSCTQRQREYEKMEGADF